MLQPLLHDLNYGAIPAELPSPYSGDLPSFIPQLVPRERFPWRMPPVVGITLTHFISEEGSFAGGLTTVERLRKWGVRDVVLVGTGQDPRLEKVWRNPQEFFRALHAAGITTVLGPSFSIYLDRPATERVVNRARNLRIFEQLNEFGCEAIPAVGFIDARDARHVAGWVASLALHTVFIDLQSADSEWPRVRSAIPVFVRESGIRRLVVNGVGQPDRIRELVGLATPARLTLTTSAPAFTARMGCDYFREHSGGLVKRLASIPPERVFWNLGRYVERVAVNGAEYYVCGSPQPLLLYAPN